MHVTTHAATRTRNEPLRILMSNRAREAIGPEIIAARIAQPHLLVDIDQDAEVAFVSRDVTGLSSRTVTCPDTQRFYDAMLAARSLRWVHVHSSGADRPIYNQLRARGVLLTTSPGANASVVVQTALAGMLALARRLPQLMDAQRRRAWEPLVASGLPRDLEGQNVVIVGWGLIGQGLATLLTVLGLRVSVVRHSDQLAAGCEATVPFERIHEVLPHADWLVLACPLTARTRKLIDARVLAAMPRGAFVVNVSRGEVIHEQALEVALESGHLGGAYLDVFEHEPLPGDSPLWSMPNVIVTPHCAGHSDGNARRVDIAFLENLARYVRGEALYNACM